MRVFSTQNAILFLLMSLLIFQLGFATGAAADTRAELNDGISELRNTNISEQDQHRPTKFYPAPFDRIAEVEFQILPDPVHTELETLLLGMTQWMVDVMMTFAISGLKLGWHFRGIFGNPLGHAFLSVLMLVETVGIAGLQILRLVR